MCTLFVNIIILLELGQIFLWPWDTYLLVIINLNVDTRVLGVVQDVTSISSSSTWVEDFLGMRSLDSSTPINHNTLPLTKLKSLPII